MSENDKTERSCAAPPSSEAALERFDPQLHRFLSRSLRGAQYQYAADLVQDIYVRFLSLPHREQILKPRAYLFRIASNLLAEYRLREQRSQVVFDSELADMHLEHDAGDIWKDALGESLQMRQRLEQLLAQMPPTQRVVTVLWARDGLSPAEIARQTGLTPQTTRKYLTRALAHLKAAQRRHKE
jgi:RNA polymerase sigma factor (sigma-70 family)